MKEFVIFFLEPVFCIALGMIIQKFIYEYKKHKV